MMNATGRASSLSPTSIQNDSCRNARPPPPVRPKPKRTVTAPVMTTVCPRASITDGADVDSELVGELTKKKTLVTSKGTVKALAERFEVCRSQSGPDPVYGVKSTSDASDSNKVKNESKPQRSSAERTVGATSLRFPKPPPPAHHGRRQISLNDATGRSNAIQKQNDKNAPFVRYHSDSTFKSADKKRDSLERRRMDGGRQIGSGKKIISSKVTDSSRSPVASKLEGCKNKVAQLKRSRSCEVVSRPNIDSNHVDGANADGANSLIRRRRNSSGLSSVAAVTMPIVRLSTANAAPKKVSPPAVPPKPPKRRLPSKQSPHDYVAYDVLSTTSPAAVFPLPQQLVGTRKVDNRRSLPSPRSQAFRRLPDAPPVPTSPMQVYQTPGRYSFGVPLPVPPTLGTMELMDDSQLNISGHIYCAVRHGDVIEGEYEATTRGSAISNASDKVIRDGNDDADDSFSAAVFGAIEEMTMGHYGMINGDGTKVIEEDAMTNYEEIIEDTLELTSKDNDTEKNADTKLPAPFIQIDDRTAMDQNSKWETCSSLTSTSADSGSSATNGRALMLIGFRRRSSNERQAELGEEESKRDSELTMMDDSLSTDTMTAPALPFSSSQHKFEKRDRETKSAPRTTARLSRQMRPKSQLDIAANSLWRIKSDIQLNLSQAMGKIRLKVSSSGSAATAATTTTSPTGPAPKNANGPAVSVGVSSPKKLEQKARSTFYLPTANSVETVSSKMPTHPTSISITLEAGLADEMASSAAASSEEDNDDEEEEDEDGEWIDTLGSEDTVGDGNFDDVTPTAAGNAGLNLPDLVPQELHKQAELSAKPRTVPVFQCDDMATTGSSSPTTTTTDGTVSNSSLGPTANAPDGRPTLVAETSCSSAGGSGLGDMERFELIYNSRFAFSEPLYQHYRSQTTMVQRNETFSEGDGKGTISRRDKLLSSSQLGSQRTLWCELPEVRGAGLLQRLKDEERKLQEAMFEVITSEASYLRSLNILITQFMASPNLSGNTALGSCITKQERKQLFSNILSVRDCSERLLCALESRLEENVLLQDVCDLIYEHLRRDCEVYVKYCSNQIYQERTLNELRRTNAEFRQVIGQLESNPICECLNLRSFLMLPMQRVTRYPLLAAAILHRTEENSNLQATAQRAFGIAGRVVRQCNEGAKRLERIEQLIELDQMLLYREGGPKRVALVSGSRWLIKKGAVFHFFPRRHTLGVRGGLRHRRICLFLFTDMLLITKPVEGDKRFVVKDYCQRPFVDVTPLEPSCPQIPDGSNLPATSCLFLCTLMKNHRGRQVELILNCDTETDKTRWLEAIRPASAQEDGDERIYEPWDCPQVRVMKEYHAVQEDELQLEVGEIINVLRKMPDGWYEGERMRDGEKGWFPGYLTEEILSDHIRAKNYRDRLRFINEAELLQRSIYMGDSTSTAFPSSSSSGTNSRRSSIIPTAAKALFRL